MNVLGWTSVSAVDFCQSPTLRRTFATFSNGAYVRIDVDGGKLALKSLGTSSGADIRDLQSVVTRIDAAPGELVSLELLDPGADVLPPLNEDGRGGAWHAFACAFENGAVDYLYIRLRNEMSDSHLTSVLRAIWPVLRADCLKEVGSPESEAAISAMLWTVSKKTDSAVLVLNAAGQILHVNAAGRDMLETGQVLRETAAGLACGRPGQTGAFNKAIRACLSDPNEDADYILFLDSADGMARVPVSLSRHQASRHTLPLVVAIIPQQPNRERIETLALKMGLTHSEARVAALMQLGLPNREAARIAGLKEQTFSTYSKRVMAKLNINCRAEMAHMLTWQSSVGRLS
jgi:DNA-binding CsgD family transcriptional regulator